MITRSSFPVRTTCSVLEVSTSAYYQWKNKSPSADVDAPVLAAIREIAQEFSRYGYKRMTKELHRRGFAVNHKRVYRLMKENALLVKRKRSGPQTTNSKHSLPRYANHAKEKVTTGTNQVWVADITYIHLREEFVYLALIMDRHSRTIVGWDLSRNVDADLTLTALRNAVKVRGDVRGCIHHSDHGVQYLCKAYIQALQELGMMPSMGEIGNSYDNAHAESLNKTIKNEEVWINEYETFEQAFEAIANFVKKYNERRLHSSIGYMPPMEFEQQLNMEEVS